MNRDRYGIPVHWTWMKLPEPGVNGWSPGLADFFYDELELGGRIACAYDDEAEWGASGIILFMGVPGAPWSEAS